MAAKSGVRHTARCDTPKRVRCTNGAFLVTNRNKALVASGADAPVSGFAEDADVCVRPLLGRASRQRFSTSSTLCTVPLELCTHLKD